MINISSDLAERIQQGDVIRDVEYFEYMTENDGFLEISKISFPAVVVLTQDCDLAQDYKFRNKELSTQDKWLISVLVAPMYNADHVFNGNHLSEIGINSVVIRKNKPEGNTLINNKNPRYHYVEFPENVEMVPSIIDFKHYFSIPVPILVEQKKVNIVCSLSKLNRADLSQRFASFLSRIGLPDINFDN